jgi:predicted 2-oxoglutarate/Fe(II)-dependent dioxygenase YbiX
MNEELLNNNYIIIPDFINLKKSFSLKTEFERYCENNSTEFEYNNIPFLEILCEKTSYISKIVGESLLPISTYATTNTIKDTLKKFDNVNEISLIVYLGDSFSKSFFTKSFDDIEYSIELNSGDAILFLNNITDYLIENENNNSNIKLFLHYVRSRGNYLNLYFDEKIKPLNLISNNIKVPNKIMEKTDFIDKKTHNIQHIETAKNIKTPENFVENYENNMDFEIPRIISASNKLEDFIQVFDDIMSEETCDFILNEYENSNEWTNGLVSSKSIDENVRDCSTISLSSGQIISNNIETRQKIDSLIYESIKNVLGQYVSKFPSFNIEIDTGYNLLRYTEGQFYSQHTDSFKEQQRSVSCSIHLNENYDGGEFAFFDREVMIRCKKGSVVVFPSNFMYPHEIMPIIRGTRYSIVTWFI